MPFFRQIVSLLLAALDKTRNGMSVYRHAISMDFNNTGYLDGDGYVKVFVSVAFEL